MNLELATQAANRWRSILPQLGVAPAFLANRQGPCPICGGKDRFRWDNKDGRGTFFCNACGSGDGIRLAMLVNGWAFPEAAIRIRAVLPGSSPEAVKRATPRPDMAKRLWSGSRVIGDDDAARYLRSRGYLPAYPDQLRFHPACPLYDQETGAQIGTYPAMLARVASPDGVGAAIHRTYLENGQKANIPSPRRLTSGHLPKGSAIRLGDHGDVLGIAEGVETALAASKLDHIPCWAAISAQMLADFVWPQRVCELHIFGDNDANFTGQAATYRLANRAALKGLIVKIHIPDHPGMDWDDIHRMSLEERGNYAAP